MPEQNRHSHAEQSTESPETALPRELVGQACPVPMRLNDALVAPSRLRQHGRLLQEAPAWVELGDREVIEVDRDDPEEQQPTAAELFAHCNVADSGTA